jgi:hypothetical protein
MDYTELVWYHSLNQSLMFIHCYFCFAIGFIDGVKWDDIVTEVPNTLVEVGCKEQAHIIFHDNANGITKEP